MSFWQFEWVVKAAVFYDHLKWIKHYFCAEYKMSLDCVIYCETINVQLYLNVDLIMAFVYFCIFTVHVLL